MTLRTAPPISFGEQEDKMATEIKPIMRIMTTSIRNIDNGDLSIGVTVPRTDRNDQHNL